MLVILVQRVQFALNEDHKMVFLTPVIRNRHWMPLLER
jgi:hypothetical protein